MATRILPLAEVTLTEPSRPRSSTAPEVVPTITSVPVGQRTAIDCDGLVRPDLNDPIICRRDLGATFHDHTGTVLGDHVHATRGVADAQTDTSVRGW